MTTVRSSPRLAKAASKPQSTEGDMDLGNDSDFDPAAHEDDKVRPLTHKRRRTSATRVAKSQSRRKQARAQQGRLSILMRLPLEIFRTIASYLQPGDIISLARSNRFLRRFLMTRSSRRIWQTSMKNVLGLPPCPRDLSEPYYLALFFSKYCTNCGRSSRKAKEDEILLRVRLCPSCRKDKIMPLYEISVDLFNFVYHSADLKSIERPSAKSKAFVLRDEAFAVETQYKELTKSGDRSALEDWKERRGEMVSKWRKQAKQVIYFLEILEIDQIQQEGVKKTEYRREIERRLTHLGWEQADMQFTYLSPMRKKWFSLVEKPKMLSDQIWKSLLPQLVPILQVNHQERQARERLECRRRRLEELFASINSNARPVIQLKVSSPTDPYARFTSNLATVTHVGVFPEIVDALEWPIIKRLIEGDTEIHQMEAHFEEHRAQVSSHIADWKLAVETHMATLLCESHNPGENEAITAAILWVNQNGHLCATLSPNLAVLLRADSFFCLRTSPTGPPLTYDAAVATWRRRNALSLNSSKPLDLTYFHPYAEAQAAAQVLLKNMNKPNACYLEVGSVGKQYVCARCHDNSPKTWEEIVYHYVDQKRQWDRIQSELPTLVQDGIAYNDVHGSTKSADKPLTTCLPSIQQDGELTTLNVSLRSCCLCAKAPIKLKVHGLEDKILSHMLEVHEVTEPKFQEHYESVPPGGINASSSDTDFDDDGPYGPFE